MNRSVVPLGLYTLFYFLYGMSDIVILSTCDTYSGGLEIVYPLLFIFGALPMWFSMGVGELIRKAKYERSRLFKTKVIESTLFAALALSFIYMVLLSLCSPQLINILTTSKSAYYYGMEYLHCMLPVLVILFLNHVLVGIAFGEGDEGCLHILLIGVLCKFIINPFFIPESISIGHFSIPCFDQGVAGAAASTVISQLLIFTSLLFRFVTGKMAVTIKWKISHVSLVFVKRVVAAGYSGGVATILAAIVIIIPGIFGSGSSVISTYFSNNIHGAHLFYLIVAMLLIWGVIMGKQKRLL